MRIIWTLVLVGLVSVALSAQVHTYEVTQRTRSQSTVQASPDNPERNRRGSLLGTVTDESGKPIPSASVQLTDTVTEEAASTTTTNDKGEYSFRSLLPGDYAVEATKNGKHSATQHVKVSDGPSQAPQLVLKDVGR
jgi:protocatechuate 3,4-dioxygenase beta subunit